MGDNMSNAKVIVSYLKSELKNLRDSYKKGFLTDNEFVQREDFLIDQLSDFSINVQATEII
jgi:hypothetical protein|tara:strand:- start:33 stop:215 length:183 start_codon:yes stop_codon:yes gene_type:complete